MKLISWNLNGIRAVAGKGLTDILTGMNADVICLQETKASPEQVREALFGFTGYEIYANIGEKKGYSGTAILSRTAPIMVRNGIGMPEHDDQGRVITAEFEKFFVVNTYVPNSGSELARLPYRQTWDSALLSYFKELEQTKPVIWCGDMNVAHKPIDLKNDKANYNKTAGYMQQEIDGMNNYHAADLVDTFRHFYPEVEKYSWWSYRAGAREKNVGWRIDYFMVSKSFIPAVKDAFILNDVHGSDHCPVGIDLF
ncbi:MAG: exodeoxyribonuclease III [Bacteroidota bacterium]